MKWPKFVEKVENGGKLGSSRQNSCSPPPKKQAAAVAAEGILGWGAKLLIKRQSYKSAKKSVLHLFAVVFDRRAKLFWTLCI